MFSKKKSPTKAEPTPAPWPFNHRFDPSVAKGGVTTDGISVDKQLISRLIESDQHKTTNPSGQWEHIFADKQRGIQEAIDSKDVDRVSEILSNPNASDLLYGFDSNAKSLLGGQSMPTEDPRTYDALLSLADALGVMRLHNPEAGVDERAHDIEHVIDLIENKVGFEIVMPSIYPRDFGLSTSRGVIHYRTVLAVYQAWRTLGMLSGDTSRSVLEIGGGLGRAAYFAWKLGIEDYTIVDIPLTAITQGFFLGHTLGESVVLLEGEPEVDSDSRIKLISPEKLFADEKRYDLIVNFDGLTEFSTDDIRRYWNHIRANTDVFLSVNHEANEIDLHSLTSDHQGTGDYERFPFWLRKGYVEEIWRLQNR